MAYGYNLTVIYNLHTTNTLRYNTVYISRLLGFERRCVCVCVCLHSSYYEDIVLRLREGGFADTATTLYGDGIFTEWGEGWTYEQM